MDRSLGARGFAQMIADSPVFLPLKLVEPSPTTGALNQHTLPPLFHNTLARSAAPSTAGVLKQEAAAFPYEERAQSATATEVRPGAPCFQELVRRLYLTWDGTVDVSSTGKGSVWAKQVFLCTHILTAPRYCLCEVL
jgi:hypothetical protein